MNFKLTTLTMAKAFCQLLVHLTTIIVRCQLRFRVFVGCQLFIFFFFGPFVSCQLIISRPSFNTDKEKN